jgi:exonuclease SbcC
VKFDDAKLKYSQALLSADFASIEKHKDAFREQTWLSDNKLIIQHYEKDVHSAIENIRTHESVFSDKMYNPDELGDIIKRENALINSIDESNSIKGRLLEHIENLNENLNKRQEQEKKLELTRKEKERWQRLAEVISANSLRDFALKTMFDFLIRFANRQLSDITSRYTLKAVDMRDMVVIDRWNAGEERPVETLSGGESFLVSLSLALALSELSKGRSRLESLFLDEGFGTLDPETLEAALCALENLRLSGRTIGVISHIDQLTRRIPVRIEVSKTGNGSSKINLRG